MWREFGANRSCVVSRRLETVYVMRYVSLDGVSTLACQLDCLEASAGVGAEHTRQQIGRKEER